MSNPIYREYYSHENADCYKIDLPWSDYRKDTRVLCKVSEGYDYAVTLAVGIIMRHLGSVVEKEPKEEPVKA
jgi:hypothetical protein